MSGRFPKRIVLWARKAWPYIITTLAVVAGAILFSIQEWNTGFRGKTLWDWLDLIVVPVVLGVGALWFNNQLAKRQELSQQEQFREEALHAYFDDMSHLLLQEKLKLRLSANPDSKRGKPAVVDVAQLKTSTILYRVDKKRRDEVINFLRAAGLLTGEQSMFTGASLSRIDLANNRLFGANFQGAYLERANFNHAILARANLQRAELMGADLQKAMIANANLKGAFLEGANLQRALLGNCDLQHANFLGANLQGAILHGADLQDANFTGANLRGASLEFANLKGAGLWGEYDEKTVLPDGTHWTPDTDLTRFTDPRHPDFQEFKTGVFEIVFGFDEYDD